MRDEALEELCEKYCRHSRIGVLWGRRRAQIVHDKSKEGILDGEGDNTGNDAL